MLYLNRNNHTVFVSSDDDLDQMWAYKLDGWYQLIDPNMAGWAKLKILPGIAESGGYIRIYYLRGGMSDTAVNSERLAKVQGITIGKLQELR